MEALILNIKAWAEAVIHSGGYPGIAFLMLIGSANVPLPSEVVLPFGGILSQKRELNLHLVALSGTIGAVLGSLISYALGYKLGKESLLKYGKYFFVRAKEVEHGEVWFNRHGLAVTLWGRCIPVVRSFVSLPAGIYRSDIKKFTLYAFLGNLPWCYLWTYIGLKVGDNWEVISKNMKYVDVLVVLAALLLIAKFVRYRMKEKAAAEAQ